MKPILSIRQRVTDYVTMVRGVITTSRIAEALDLNKGTVKRELYRLHKAGVIEQVGRIRAGKVYVLAPPPPPRSARMCRDAVLASLQCERKDFMALAKDVGGDRNQVVNACAWLRDQGRIHNVRNIEDVDVYLEMVI